MKSSWFWLAMVVVTLAFLAGCGGAEPPKPQPAATEAAAPPPPPPAAQPPAAAQPPPAAEPPPAAQQEAAEPPPAAQQEAAQPPPAEEPAVDATVPEFDIEPFYEGEMVAMESPAPPPEEEPMPPPRAIEAAEPPAMAEEERAEEYVAAVEAPPQPAAAMPEFGIVYFDFDKYNIKPEFEQVIRDNAQKLMADTGISVTVEGHCDERGTTEYNLALGERRARALRDALVSIGVSASQLGTVSYGEERPVAFGHDETSWGQNRRAVLTIR